MKIAAWQRRNDARGGAASSRARRIVPPHALALVASAWSGVAVADDCRDLAGRLVAVEGDVTVAERPGRMGDEICSGESIEVGALSRAAVRLEDTQTVVRIDQNSTFLIIPSDAERSWLELIRGVIYLFSRRPESLRVGTPYVNAAIDGTEFVVEAVDGTAEVTVIEGSVLVDNALGEVRVSAGERASADVGRSPRRRTVVDPLDAVQWALHYPPIGAAENTSDAVRTAAELLASGEVERAVTLLAGAAEDAASLALQAMIAITRNRANDAMRLAEQAVDTDAGSSVAYIALSYAQQARFEIEQALTSANVAVRNDPRSAHALARRAELELGVDDTAAALASAREAIDVAPENSRARTVLGFARLVRLEVGAAASAFTAAIVRDPGDPLPRLGLGLATIRDGRLVEGREHLEIAAALDPNDALVRSYLGKAYAEEREADDAAAQFVLAQRLDPQDPTPWFYDALLAQALNRPVEAFRKMERARALNDNRLVYQSRLLVDKSDAAGSLSLARIYTDLGFEQPAINESTRSIETDPTNFSAYRFLADSYAQRERHEAARRSVLFQAALLQPLTIDPVQPYAQESDLLILPGTDPVDPSIREYSPLFDREGLQLAGSVVAGDDDTFGDNLVLSGLHDRVAYSLGQFHYETDGFRENADIEHDVYHGVILGQILPTSFLQVGLLRQETDQGDLRLGFDPRDFSQGLRRHLDTTAPSVGLRTALGSRTTLLFSARAITHSERQSTPDAVPPNAASFDADGHEVFARVVRRGDIATHSFGVDAHDVELETTVSIGFDPCPFVSCVIDTGETESRYSDYFYRMDIESSERFRWTFGVGYTVFDDELLDLDERHFSPEIGLRWKPAPSQEIRLAASRGVSRRQVADLRLKPTVLAGFNQVYDDFAGTRYRNVGAAYDWQFGSVTRFGAQLFHRELDIRPLATFPVTGVIRPFDEPQRETTLRGYWSRIVRSGVVIETESIYERFERDASAAGAERRAEVPLAVQTLSLPVGVRYFHPSGFFARAEISAVYQAIERDQTSSSEAESTSFVVEDDEYFTNLDLSVGVKMRRHRATLRLDVRNLFDEAYLFQGHDLQPGLQSSPRFSPGLTAVGRVSFSFR